jgi:quercetin dioxygenase-like cupin family protein
MQISEAATAQSGDVGEARDGIQDSRLLLYGKENTPTNFKLNLSHAVTDWKAPRHRHDFDQFRYVISGEFIYGKDKDGKDRVLPPGYVAYFPEGIHYGPQIRRQGVSMVLCQLGGASGNGFLSKMQRRKAHAELKEAGTFDKGVYTWVDAEGNKHNQDSSEAVSERAMNGKITYPEPRYNDIIVMNPANYKWVDAPGAPGVALKWLGTFTERESRIGFVRIDAGATFEAGSLDVDELFYVTQGSVTVDGKICAVETGIGLEPHEGPVKMKATETCELLHITGPRFY